MAADYGIGVGRGLTGFAGEFVCLGKKKRIEPSVKTARARV